LADQIHDSLDLNIVTAANVNHSKRPDEVLSAIVVKRQRTHQRRNKHLCADDR
jgi:hypothetical protein